MFLCKRDVITEGNSKGFVVSDASFFAVQQFGKVFVYRNRCPHLGIELEWLPDRFLDSEGELIQCATHGALFTIDTGLCIAGPCVGEALEPVPVIERDGNLYLLLAPTDDAAAPAA